MKTFCTILIHFFFSIFCFGQKWDSLKGGLDSYVYTLYTDTITNILYAGGNFEFADGIPVNGIAQWNGSKWDSLLSGISAGVLCNYACNVRCLTKYNNKIYAGGDFTIAGNVNNVQGIAAWDGAQWNAVSTGMGFDNNYAVLDMLVYNNELYACGSFDSAGSISANRIAKWNGTQWDTVANDTSWGSDYLTNVIFYKGELYIAGNFYDVNSGIRRIAKWNGSHWQALGNGIVGSLDGVSSMAVYNNELYVGGSMTKTDGNAGNCIQKWDGNTWLDVGGGMDFMVNKLFVYKNKLYAAGQFTTAGGVPANNIAIWDGVKWCGLGSSFDNLLSTITFYNDTMYIAGAFTKIDGINITRIAQWTGGSYVDTCGALGVSENNLLSGINVFPNPASENITVAMELKEKQNVEITLYNLLGGILYSETLKNQSGTKQKQISLSDFSSGIYILKIKLDNKIIGKKIIKQY